MRFFLILLENSDVHSSLGQCREGTGKQSGHGGAPQPESALRERGESGRLKRLPLHGESQQG